MRIFPITVIIPTWNRAHLLERALDSVLRQTVCCSEIIVVDDGSTDETEALLAERKKKYPLLHVLRQENKGPAAARNLAIKAAKNEYLAFLDSDDHWYKTKLEKQFSSLAESDFLISHTYEKWLRRGKHLNQKKIHIPRHGDIFDHCLRLCAVGMSTVMVKKELFARVGLFDETMRCCEDYDFWLRTSAFYPFLLIEEVLTVKEGGRIDQLSQLYRVGMDEKRIASLRKLLAKNILTKQQQKSARLELLRKLRIFSTGCFKHGKTELGEKYLALIQQYQGADKSL